MKRCITTSSAFLRRPIWADSAELPGLRGVDGLISSLPRVRNYLEELTMELYSESIYIQTTITSRSSMRTIGVSSRNACPTIYR